jgi:hypothetical protein
MLADLHLHTTASDGRWAPDVVVREAAARGILTVAITDHDTVAGLERAHVAAAEIGVTVIPGIELSAQWDGHTTHVLGYGIDVESTLLLEHHRRRSSVLDSHRTRVESLIVDHEERAEVQQVFDELGSGLSAGALIVALVKSGVLRRVANGAALLKAAATEPPAIAVSAAIELIHAARGVAVLAHPVRISRRDPHLQHSRIEALANVGLDGIEVWQPVHGPDARRHYLQVTRDLGLLATGGSDCHGPTSRGAKLGQDSVGADVLAPLVEAIERRQSRV